MLTDQPTDVVLTELLDALPDAVIWMRAIRDEANRTTDFRIEYANQKAQELTKGNYVVRTGTLVLGDTGHERAEAERTFGEMCAVLDTNQPQEFSYFSTKFDGWLLVNRAKLGDGILSVTRNISALKAVEQTNIRQANLLNSVLDSSSSGIKALEAVRDEQDVIIDFVVIAINKMGATIRQRAVGEIVNQPILRVFPGVREAGLFDQYVHVTETRESRRIQTKYPVGEGEIWYEMALSPFGDGLTVTYTNISENRKTQQDLEQLADQLRTVIDSAQVAIYLIEPVLNEAAQIVDFRFQTANQMLASYIGLEAHALTGELVSRWFPAYLTNGLFDRYLASYETGRTQHFNFHYQTDRIDVWIKVTITRLGQAVLVTFSDYTDFKELQQQLETLVVDLQRSNKNLEQFAYVASHDLQEPLRKIQAFGDILQTQYAPAIGDGGADIIQRMQSAAARMQVLIKDVLAYSRIATKRETIESVDLSQVMSEVLTDIDTTIAEKQATVKANALPTVRGDAAQLRQLFQNLISNALKFTKADKITTPAVITITARQVCGRDLPNMGLPPAEADRSFHLIDVEDNGIGFDPRQAKRIFEVFQRLHNRSEYQGTGIGLAIVQKVIENHNGYISAEGRPGEGATFRVALPA